MTRWDFLDTHEEEVMNAYNSVMANINDMSVEDFVALDEPVNDEVFDMVLSDMFADSKDVKWTKVENREVKTEDYTKYQCAEINAIQSEFDRLYEEYDIDRNTLKNNGEIYYMNGNMGTDGDWQMNNHVSYFMSFYEESDLGFAKIAIDREGKLYGCVWLDDGKGEAIDIKEDAVSQYPEEFAALCYEQTDELGKYDEPISNIDWNAKISSTSYGFLWDEDDEEDEYWEDDYADGYDDDDEYWEDEEDLDESKKVQESKILNEDSEGNVFDDRDKKIFQDLKNQEENETVYDLISNRIGEDITVGELNTILQSIFGKYDDIFLLHNDLYNADTDEPQDLVIWDDDDMYTIVFNIVDIEEGIIEITDVDVE